MRGILLSASPMSFNEAEAFTPRIDSDRGGVARDDGASMRPRLLHLG